MSKSVEKMTKQLANLVRNKRRAKRRGDPNFYRISAECKALKLRIETAIKGE